MNDRFDQLVSRKISDYVLVRAIGRGTHCTLYQAVDPGQGQMAVIKILHVAAGTAQPDAEVDAASVQETRLQREAHALLSLSHPGIPEIYEVGEQDGHPFLIMEYLVGHPLRQHLDRRALPLEEVLSILEQVASAVDAVHAQGILHRDIRASNVMILNDGRVKLVEFGLARQPGDTTVTLMGTLVGEPAYLSPEQLRNQPASPQSDLWAVGVLMYEMLTGRPPFEGANFQLAAHQVIMGQPAPVSGLSPAMQAVLSRALEKEPDKRYPNAQEMVKALRKASGASSSASRPRPRAAQARKAPVKPAPKQRYGWAGVTLAILAVALVIGFFLGRHTSSFTPTVSAATRAPHSLKNNPFRRIKTY